MDKKLNKVFWSVVIVWLTMVSLLVFIFMNSEASPVGSVARTGEYRSLTATTTVSTVDPVLKVGQGTFGSVIIAVTGTAPLTLYDASTTVASLRAKSTSTLKVLARFGASPTVGTYTYDTVFNDGLIAVWETGTIASSTITYR